jgi:uncharacterized protein with gpF-like domain
MKPEKLIKKPPILASPEKQLAYINRQAVDLITKDLRLNLFKNINDADLLGSYFEQLDSLFSSKSFQKHIAQILAVPIKRSGQQAQNNFYSKLPTDLSVDFKKVVAAKQTQELFKMTISENTKLIKNMAQGYIGQVQTVVNDGVIAGLSPTALSNQIADRARVSKKRARLIARDQYAKTLSAVERQRSEDSGLVYYRWRTTGTQRVSGDPAGLYPNASVKCYEIARRDIGFGEGVYTYKKGASYKEEKNLHPGTAHINCMCTYEPLIEGINFTLPKDKKRS